MVAQQPTPGAIPVYEDFSRCVHCGLCLNHCPTYRLWQLEADSPRGRIRQMMLVNQGELLVSEGFVDHIDKCLDCRSCETACPSAVDYGMLVEHARARIERDFKRPLFPRLARTFLYRRLLPYPERIAMAAKLLRFYQRSGLQSHCKGHGNSEAARTDGARLVAAAGGSPFLFRSTGQNVSRAGSAPRP